MKHATRVTIEVNVYTSQEQDPAEIREALEDSMVSWNEPGFVTQALRLYLASRIPSDNLSVKPVNVTATPVNPVTK
jgi:hypothetical protein